MDIRDLTTFATVAKSGGIGRAARELNTVQSNVTQRVRRLETDLGVVLLERRRSGTTPTAAGRRLLPYAARLDTLLAEARRAARDDGAPQGPLAIGALETTAALRLSPLLASYARSHPQVDMILRTGTTAEMIDQVLDRTLEGAFVCGPVTHPALVATPAFDEELALLTAPPKPTMHDLLDRSDLRLVILRAGCSYRQRLEELLARRGIVGLRRLEFGTIEAILGAVAAGLGITLLPKSLIGPAWRGGQIAVTRLPVVEAHVETVFVRRRDMTCSQALRAFHKHVTRKSI
ncbi:DNA-binding transcriptional regulator, LysR family [Enhydrobacter aerosaccus]|uniref:DNA-binding transcriptional regulator, LysR family n=1 Tax=Enhydrobacter aerosaccus TaxID=225324 RepID=A0A1T4KSK6_9HYPH|nr:LysR family transcriptional regulator [Enhydrobacter aerosaccus]SJZ45318.1 DNA-binding transcriptional regulator, LysR family [Enhydrobacter aerosaccus]